VAISGRFAVVLFDDDGKVRGVVRIGAMRSGAPLIEGVGVEVHSHEWHTVLAEQEGSVLLEIKAGPFSPEVPKELAPWAPMECSGPAVEYFRWLRDVVLVEQ
jgi:cupin fold WbuC family metalloprotein